MGKAREGALERGPRGLTMRSRVSGAFRPPGSKALAQRALVSALLCPEPTVIAGISAGDDVAACLALVREAGAAVERVDPVTVRVTGPRPGALAVEGTLAVGESGTLARFATALAGLCRRSRAPVLVHGEGTLARRRSAPLFAALRRAGVGLRERGEPGGWPVEVGSSLAPAEIVLERPCSSQEVSALLIAAAALPSPAALSVTGPVPSAPYVAMTGAILARFGVEVREEESDADPGSPRRFVLRGPLRAPGKPLALEGDASSGAVVLAAACLSGGSARVLGVPEDSLQGDARIARHLDAFGCTARREGDALVAEGFPERGARLDLAGEPDLAPVLAAVAAAVALRHARASRLSGLGTLGGKESDRLAVLAGALERCGLVVASTRDALEIAPGTRSKSRRAILLDPRGDHRMAFAFALLGLVLPDVTVADPGCVAKSWPRFWEDLEALGAEGVAG